MIALRIASGSPSHAPITCCKSVSGDATSRQLERPECSARAARYPWQKSQPQSLLSLPSKSPTGSNPVAQVESGIPAAVPTPSHLSDSRKATEFWESSAGSPGDHANPPPVLPVLFVARRNLARQRSWSGDRRWQFVDGYEQRQLARFRPYLGTDPASFISIAASFLLSRSTSFSRA